MTPVTPLAKKRFFQSIHAMEKRVKSEADGAWDRGSPCVGAAVAIAHPRGKVDEAVCPATDADTRRLGTSTESTREDTGHSSKLPRQPSLAPVEADLKRGHGEERAETPEDASKGKRVSKDAALSKVEEEDLTLRVGGREDQTLPESHSPKAIQMNPDKVASELVLQGNKSSQCSKASPIQSLHTEEDKCQLANAKVEQPHFSAQACPAEEPAAQLRSPVVVPLQEDGVGGEHCAINKALTDYSLAQCFSPLAAWHVNAVHKGWAEVSPWAGSEAPLSEEQAPLGTQVCLRSPLNPVTLVFSNAPNSASPGQPCGSTTPGKNPAEEQASENPAAISSSECTDVSSPFVRHATIGSLGFSSFGLDKSNGGTPTNSLLTPSACVGTPSSLSLGAFGLVALESPADGEPLRRMPLRDDTPGSEAAQTSSQCSLRGPSDSLVREEKPGASSAKDAAVAEKMAVDGLVVAESDAGRGVSLGEAADGQMRPSVSFVAEGELGNIEEGVERLGFGTRTRCERGICEEGKREIGRGERQDTGSLDVKGLYRVLGVAEESMGLTSEGGELRGAKVKIGRGRRMALVPINGGPQGMGRGPARDDKATEADSWDDDRKGGVVLRGFGEGRLADAGYGKAGSLMERRMEFVDEWIGKFSKEDVEPFRLASLIFAREVAKQGSACGGVLGDAGATFEETIWCEILEEYGLMAEGH